MHSQRKDFGKEITLSFSISYETKRPKINERMAMKMLSQIFMVSVAIVGSSYSMNKEETFKADMIQLRKPIADFVNDFATWPKEEQEKIKIFNNETGMGYVIEGKPAAAGKYNNNIGYYLDCRLDGHQIGHFLAAVDYLKTKK